MSSSEIYRRNRLVRYDSRAGGALFRLLIKGLVFNDGIRTGDGAEGFT